MKKTVLIVVLTIAVCGALFAQRQVVQRPIYYAISFPNAIHHEAEVVLTVPDAPTAAAPASGTLRVLAWRGVLPLDVVAGFEADTGLKVAMSAAWLMADLAIMSARITSSTMRIVAPSCTSQTPCAHDGNRANCISSQTHVEMYFSTIHLVSYS